MSLLLPAYFKREFSLKDICYFSHILYLQTVKLDAFLSN